MPLWNEIWPVQASGDPTPLVQPHRSKVRQYWNEWHFSGFILARWALAALDQSEDARATWMSYWNCSTEGFKCTWDLYLGLSHFAFVHMNPLISCTPDCPLTSFLERANELFRNSGHSINFLNGILTSQLRDFLSKQLYDDTCEGLISRTIYRDWNLLNHWEHVCKCAAGHLSAYVKINRNKMTNIQ